ncbi:MAG: sigma-54-dependent Fis family transcriptional regulator [Planctomycetes bacterium]|nr:sigma-54-dependent Fis family transcriptional regulator [Planctomycetota bacterium]
MNSPGDGAHSDGHACRSTERGEEEHASGGELQAVLMVRRVLKAGLAPEAMLDLALAMALEATGAERGFVVTSDGLERDAPRLRVRAARNYGDEGLSAPERELSRGIAGEALRLGKPVRVDEAARDRRFRDQASVQALGLRSVLAVPMVDGAARPGVVYVEHREAVGRFGVEEEDFLSSFARELAGPLETVLGRERAEAEVARLRLALERGALEAGVRTLPMVGSSPAFVELLRQVEAAARSTQSLLIVGETGTGKEVVARAVHAAGPRRARPFIAESCAALPEEILQAELFGHEAGAFTGADRARPGLVRAADGGTLFLDEVGDMGAALQGALLRVLQEGEVRPLGAEVPVRVDVRFIAATHRDLPAMAREDRFRRDLLYRLGVIRIRVPPLRERRSDVLPLVRHFLQRDAGTRAAGLTLDPAAERVLRDRHPWPGNVRELEAEVQRWRVLGLSRVREEDLSPEVRGDVAVHESPLPTLHVEELERLALREALGRHGGSVTRAAEALGLHRDTVYRKMRRYGIVAS